MVAAEKSEQVLWLADCYNLAKHFPDLRAWMSLLEPNNPSFNPFDYWLWLEIWKASHSELEAQTNSNSH